MAGFLSPLRLEYLDGRRWAVLQAFTYAIGRPESTVTVAVPQGFVTDFASIPQLLWTLLPPTGWYGKAAVIHDYLYQGGIVGLKSITRKYADDVFAEALRVLAAERLVEFGSVHGELRDMWDRTVIYLGVRVGGWVAWTRYRRAEQ